MRAARLLAGTVLALAAGFCGTGAWTYAQARTDDALTYGRQRDQALAEGRAGIAVLTTLDASTRQRAEAGIRAWRAAATGPLRDALGRTRPEAGASARGTVTEAAVTALDTRTGTAKLIATVSVEVTPAGTTRPATDRKRLEAVLTRTDAGEWKVRALNAVPLAGHGEEDR
ncbi:hypothetical protein [Streptomyces glaucescens]|uniref:Secreted protein n=1 Tax=Streptomyces glaucescens TaxID=1907 RepID=A0A089Z7U1_STRGA|nr:hypothetical protein [Streptomyces glaucescens]AIS01841.1 secreted protein [Streptomyces glaucescens]